MPKKHNRKLGLSGAAMTTARIPKFSIEVGTVVRDELEAEMIDCGYLECAPFDWITISLRYGIKNEEEPHYEPINKEYGDIPLAIELDTNELVLCDRQEMKRAFEIAALKALIHAGQKFDLEHSALVARLRESSLGEE